MATRAPIAVIAVFCVLAGAGTTLSNALGETAIQRHVPADSLSRISLFELFGSLASQPLGQGAAGPLAAGNGIVPALWIAGSGHLPSVVGALAVPAVRRLPTWPPGGDRVAQGNRTSKR